MTYTVVLVREEDGGYCVSVPALKGCHTEGDTLPEALEMAKEAILAYMDGERALGKSMPPDVETAALDWGRGTEALVCKVTIREAATVA
jgi:antitoxin HicB